MFKIYGNIQLKLSSKFKEANSVEDLSDQFNSQTNSVNNNNSISVRPVNLARTFNTNVSTDLMHSNLASLYTEEQTPCLPNTAISIDNDLVSNEASILKFKQNMRLNNTNNNETNETFVTRVTKCFKGKSKSQSNYKLDKNVPGEEVLQESFISNKPNEIKINMTLSSNLSVEKSQEQEQVVIIPQSYDERLEKTYCSNKSKCQLPSSKIIVSDTASWQLWIDVHVPTFILILMKISWLLYNLIVISAILVTIGYFTYVNLNGLKMEPTWITEIGNLHRHGVNSLVAVVDVVSLFTFYLFLTLIIN
jgi:hypothetical protein